MKKFKLGLAVLTASLLFCNFNVFAKSVDVDVKTKEAESVWVIAEQGVNIRQVPREAYHSIVATVPYGTELKYLRPSCAKGWSLVNYEGKMRYVITEWLSFEEPIDAAGPVEDRQDPVYIQNEPAAATFYGVCTITHYCSCSICCGIYASGYTANGSFATPNWTVATGEDLPFGTKLLINGQIYEVQDRGVGVGCVDIFCASHDEAIYRGTYSTEVYIVD